MFHNKTDRELLLLILQEQIFVNEKIQKLMSTQAEIVAKLQAQKTTIDQIASDVQPGTTSDQVIPELDQAVTDLQGSVDALRAKVPAPTAPTT